MFVKTLYSCGKINLGLWVLGREKNGYHQIFTLYHKISLCDEIEIKEGSLKVETNTGIPQQENLVYKGLILFSQETGIKPEISVYIKKKIPTGAGLGGGSSNLATVLKEVNALYGSPLSEEDLSYLVGSISSDAPFFLKKASSAIGKGRGDILKEINLPSMKFTLIVPSVEASTKRVYSALRKFNTTFPSEEELIEYISEGRTEKLRNTLGEIACELYPEIGEVLRFLKFLGKKPLVSGSGSAVFYIGEPCSFVEKGAKLRRWKLFKVESWYGV